DVIPLLARNARHPLRRRDFIAWRLWLAFVERPLAWVAFGDLQDRRLFSRASLAHVHSQLVALDFVPPVIREKTALLEHTPTLHQQVLDQARSEGRLWAEEGGLAAFVPAAPRQPFESCLMPLSPEAHFHHTSPETVAAIATLTHRYTTRLASLTESADYNWWLHQAAFDTRSGVPGWRWHLEIMPRLTQLAGFELGTGCPAAYEQSYLPFLDLFEKHSGIRMALHTSGPLAEWLDRHHGEYLDRLAALAAAGRVEIVGGGTYEPILAMLPSRDRIGQIRGYRQWLEQRLHTDVPGAWIAERVWDPGMTADLVAAGVTWTILDDFHFKSAGLRDEQLDLPWLTEGDGQTLTVFPVSEHLRYVIPFDSPQATIDHLEHLALHRDGGVAVFGDDGEKFGVWPDTHRAVFEEGWLETFFTLLEANSDWIRMRLPSEVAAEVTPGGTVWLPECSYREMTEWALSPEDADACRLARRRASEEDDFASLGRFLRGGSWRNFRHRYPEAMEMYARMMAVSNRLASLRAPSSHADASRLAEATDHLYRGQCNCSYWHGAFGGIYLPHLRNAVYEELIAADLAADAALQRDGSCVEASSADFNFDGRPEFRLANEALDCWIAPHLGGMLYELDSKPAQHNLLATLDRRPEAYHAQVLAGPGAARSVVDASQQAVFKQEGLEQRVRYDRFRRKSLIDHFYDLDVTVAAVAAGDAMERGDFAAGHYTPTLDTSPERVRLQLSLPASSRGRVQLRRHASRRRRTPLLRS
ncbi:DUF1926 domain-containing protein, partial [bacterium]|nr:DUF1926 domain-containing protein [bacterium]